MSHLTDHFQVMLHRLVQAPLGKLSDPNLTILHCTQRSSTGRVIRCLWPLVFSTFLVRCSWPLFFSTFLALLSGPANMLYRACKCAAQGLQICCTGPANMLHRASKYVAQGLQICAQGLQICCKRLANTLNRACLLYTSPSPRDRG